MKAKDNQPAAPAGGNQEENKMKFKKRSRLFFSYLGRHYKIILLFAVFAAIFALIFSLYDLETEAVIYSCVLCFSIGCAVFFVSFISYIRKHKALSDVLARAKINIDGLPEPKGVIEEDYQNIISALFEDRASVISESEANYNELSDYYATGAHQVKTPISAISLLLQAGAAPALNPEAVSGSASEGTNIPVAERDLISSELFKIQTYVDMVLQYLRSEDGSDLVIAKYDLDGIIKKSLRKYSQLFILKKLSLNFTETHLAVLTDEKWLSFIIEQLLSNGIKYTPSGSISIYAEDMRLYIADTGVGIRPEDLPRIFDKGFTGYNGRLDTKSTGVGLYLCKKTAMKLGQ